MRIAYWFKKIPYWFKEQIVVFVVGIISLIWRTESWYDIFFVYFLIHWIYSVVRIGLMGEDVVAMSAQIDRLARRNEALESYIIELEESQSKCP